MDLGALGSGALGAALKVRLCEPDGDSCSVVVAPFHHPTNEDLFVVTPVSASLRPAAARYAPPERDSEASLELRSGPIPKTVPEGGFQPTDFQVVTK